METPFIEKPTSKEAVNTDMYTCEKTALASLESLGLSKETLDMFKTINIDQ